MSRRIFVVAAVVALTLATAVPVLAGPGPEHACASPFLREALRGEGGSGEFMLFSYEDTGDGTIDVFTDGDANGESEPFATIYYTDGNENEKFDCEGEDTIDMIEVFPPDPVQPPGRG